MKDFKIIDRVEQHEKCPTCGRPSIEHTQVMEHIQTCPQSESAARDAREFQESMQRHWQKFFRSAFRGMLK